jgi:sialate O-acetylesterase
MKKILIALFSVLLLAACNKVPSKLRLHDIFSSHMVLQRNIPIKVWGTAAPGTKIDLTINNKNFSAKAGKNSAWEINIGNFEPGEPLEMTVKAKDTTIVLSDILVGDIYVCSGQSNMEFHLETSIKGAEELKGKLPSNIRYFPISKDLEFFPLDTFRFKTQWYTVDSPQLAKFSAVGYYFGKNLTEKLNIPIGLIGSNWGGTVAEAWTSAEGLKDIKDFSDAIADVKNKKKCAKDFETENNTVYADFIKNDYIKTVGMDQKWFLPKTKTTDWKPIEVPSLWENAVPEMNDFDGEVWYRTTFNIPKNFSGKTIELWLGQIDDHCIAWVNGEKIGERFGRSTWCGFEIAPSILKPKGNVLVVRVYDVSGKGGFSGNPTHFDYYPKGDRSKRLSTAGKWIYKKGDQMKRKDGEMLISKTIGPNDYPTCLFNAMIHPILKFPIKGAIWYQGESNASRAYQYRSVMKALIIDWRTLWNCGDFPFYFVQLANFMERDKKPVESEWAELREAQTMALSLPNTGMATIIDIGEATDIHPTNKHDVGKRLALNALKTTYKMDVVAHGPMYKSIEIKGNKVIVSFDDCGKTLVTSDKKAPVGFEVAGKDKKFFWADAKIDKSTIVLTCKKVKAPVAVRYAWANNPATNLYNKENLPAVPFKTDDWPGLTIDKK